MSQPTTSSASPKLLRWAFDTSPTKRRRASASGTTNDTTNALASTSSEITFLNSQLVAHGFTRPPGLIQPLSRLAATDQESVVQCLHDLLEQRITDMERMEELTSRLRNLGQDHERLIGFHQTANKKVAQSQQECEAAKARHATTTAAFVELQASHKQTMFSLQRAQSALQFARQTAQNELKRKDREIERMQERWSKLANEQPKSGLAVGMKCTNLAAETPISLPRGPSILEDSLEQLTTERERLSSQNEAFRAVLIAFATSLDRLSRLNSPSSSSTQAQSLKPITDLTLFPPSENPWAEDSENARKALSALLHSVEAIVHRQMLDGPGAGEVKSGESEREAAVRQRLEKEIEDLKLELEESRKTLTEQMNGALDAFSRDQRLLRGQPRPSAADSERSSEAQAREADLEDRERLLQENQDRLAATAIEIGKERNALAVAKLELQEERRAWKLQQMLDELPDSPAAQSQSSAAPTSLRERDVIPAPVFARDHEANTSPKRSTKARSPKKSSALRRTSPTKHRSPRRMASFERVSRVVDVIEEEEEEDDGDFGNYPTPVAGPSNSGSVTRSLSSNPFDQILQQSAQAAQSLNALNLSPERKRPVSPPLPLSSSGDLSLSPSPSPAPSPPSLESPATPKPTAVSHLQAASAPSMPSTPISLAAAQARLNANRYAPVVPSPLSRILRIAESPTLTSSTASNPNSPDVFPPASSSASASAPAPRWTLAKLVEDNEEDESEAPLVPVPLITLADELGMNMNADDADGRQSHRLRPQKSPSKRVRRSPSPRRPGVSARDKGKAKFLGNASLARPPGAASTIHGGLRAGREKENSMPAAASSARLMVPSRNDSGGTGVDGVDPLDLTAGSAPPKPLGPGPSKKITIGAKVVGGRPMMGPSHIASRGRIAMRPSLVSAGAPRSLRERVGARYGQQPGMTSAIPKAD